MERQWLAGDKATAIKWICMKSRVSRALTPGRYSSGVIMNTFRKEYPIFSAAFCERDSVSLPFFRRFAGNRLRLEFLFRRAKKGIRCKKRDGRGLGLWGEETLMDVSGNWRDEILVTFRVKICWRYG